MLLRRLPGVDRMLELAKTDAFFQDAPVSVVTKSARHGDRITSHGHS